MVARTFMKQIIALLVMCLGLASCATPKSVDSSLNREWMLTEFSGFSKEQLVKNKARLQLNQNEDQKGFLGSANMGCNTMNFDIVPQNNNSFLVKPQMMTAMACNDMKLEQSFSNIFEGTFQYQIDGHFLTLTNKKGQKMKFIAADWD